MQKQVRRIVTGHDDKGRAVIISDGAAPNVHGNKLDPDFWSAEIWRTFETPARIVAAPDEPTGGPRKQLPAPNGTVIRVNCFPPEGAAIQNLTRDQSHNVFSELGNRNAATVGGRHPLMHRTETVDYALVLSGEITMVLDEEDVQLRAGDIVVQCGTNHAWSNRSNEPCLMAFILIDGKADPELKEQFGG